MLSKDTAVQQAAPFCEGFAEHLALVDLPGFGDINSVRNQIAERYYRKADSVCICTRLCALTTCLRKQRKSAVGVAVGVGVAPNL